MVRITGKDGQEAFFELPILPKPISRPASVVAEKQISESPKRSLGRPAREVKVEKTKQEKYEEQKAAAAKMAAMTMMSGALPPPQKKHPGREAAAVEVIPWQSPARETPVPAVKAGSIASSTKDSGVQFGGMFETNATMASAQSGKATSVKSLQAAVKSISKNSRTSSKHSFQGAGEDWVQVAAEEVGSHGQHSERASTVASTSKSQTSEHYIHSMVGFEELKPPSAYAASPANNGRSSVDKQAREGSRQSVKRSDGRSPTVFAGRGCILPHPLSRSPSAFASPPQSHISLPKEDDFQGGAKMTFDDWQAMQQPELAQRRIFSRAESVVSDRVKAVAASIARGDRAQASAVASVAGSKTYHRATVESEHGGQRPGSMASQRHSVRSDSPRLAAARSASVKSNSKHGSQAFHWSPAHSQRPDANGWNALPQFDGASDERYTQSDKAAAAYKRQLQEIIAQSSPQQANYHQPADDSRHQPREVRLTMPWDGSHSSPSSSRTRSLVSQQQSSAGGTPPSAAEYSPARSGGGRNDSLHSRLGRSPRDAAPSSARVHAASGFARSGAAHYAASSASSADNSSTSNRFESIDKAERGYGGY
ncbi:hypothetical protein LTR08_007128 [Meristemomyces frigidus]|nr:hypothetical protein LTR08_007128 [Meristemomyces frigidus]